MEFGSENHPQIPDQKKLQYLEKLAPWKKERKFTKKDTESVLGTLVHCSLAVLEGRYLLQLLIVTVYL